MEKFNIIALITFHENIESLDDQVENFFKFNENSCVIINSGYDGDIESFKEKWKNCNLYIFNREIQHEYHDSLIPLHLECFNLIEDEQLQSDYVLLLSSNQLFIRPNVFNLMKKYTASYFYRFITEKNTMWMNSSKNFQRFKNILNPSNFMFQSNHDGMFFKYDVFNQMMRFFSDYYDIDDKTSKGCHLEEYLYSAYLLNNFKISDLCPYSKYNFWPKNWDQSIGILELKEAFNENLYIVKKVERKYDDPVRKMIRNLQVFKENYEQG